MIYLHTLGAASIEIDATNRCIDADGEAAVAPRPRPAERVRLTSTAPRRFALLLYLGLERGRRVGRERLQTLIFPDQSPTKARHSLREVIYQLRTVGASILTDHDDVFVPPEHVWCDAWAAVEQDPLSEETVHSISGGLLTGYAPEHSEAYSDWYEAYRATSISSLARRLISATNAATSEARWGFAERAARACLAIDPFNEGATLALAGILAVNGSKASAIDLVDRYVAEIGSQSPDLKFPAIALKRRISEGLPSRHLVQRGRNGDFADSPFITPAMVGRATELAALQETFGQVRAGASHCMVVAGEAGIGKTRLVAEFSATAVLQGARVERVTIQPHDGERPMGAFVDLVPGLLRARGALGCSPASMDALRNLIGRPASGDLPQQAAGAEEHEQRWAAVSRAVVDLCEAIASEGTLVLVIEDAHWLDTLSAQTIGRVIGAARESRIMAVATTRDPRPLVRDMRLTERCRTLTLGPLDATATNELLDVILPATTPSQNHGSNKVSGSVRLRIAEASAGNPLFLISLAAHSRVHPGEFKVPGTIVETFAQRIDTLSRRAVGVLAACAELGKHSDLTRLVRSLEIRKHELVESLLELTDIGLVLRDDQNAVLAHPLVAEALRGRMPQPARRAVAHAVATTLEADAEGEDSPSLWWDAAQTWRAAGSPERVVHALTQCAQHALEIGRPGEAASILNEAAELPVSRASFETLTASLIRASDAAAEFPLTRRAFALRHRDGISRQHDDLELADCRAALSIDHSEQSVAERLCECVASTDASASHKVEAAILLLKCADMFGRQDLARYANERLSAVDLAAADRFLQFEFELLRASSFGDRAEAANIARALLSECARSSDLRLLNFQRNAATALILAGDVDGATKALKDLFHAAESRKSPKNQLYASVQLSALFLDRDEAPEASAWLYQAITVAQASAYLTHDFELLALRVETELLHGNLAVVAELLREADAAGTFTGGIRQRFRRATQLAIQVHTGPLDDSARLMAQRIASDTFRTMTGLREFEIAVAVDALVRLDLVAEAQAALDVYLAMRDYPRTLSPLLRRAACAAGYNQVPFPFLASYGPAIAPPEKTR